MRPGDLALCASRAICGAIDQVFDGPPLIPREPVPAAMTEQWTSLVNARVDLPMTQSLTAYFFSGLPGSAPDRATIETVLPKMRESFAPLDCELGTRELPAGASFALADAFSPPLMHAVPLSPESAEMMQAAPDVVARFDRVAARPGAADTEPPRLAGRS